MLCQPNNYRLTKVAPIHGETQISSPPPQGFSKAIRHTCAVYQSLQAARGSLLFTQELVVSGFALQENFNLESEISVRTKAVVTPVRPLDVSK